MSTLIALLLSLLLATQAQADFTIPNVADAFHAAQAQVDKVDLDIVVAGVAGTGVLSGCAVTAQGSPDMTLAVASGTVKVGATVVGVTAGNVTITTAHATNPRFDLVVVDTSGTKSVTAGTAAASPVFPAIPASSVVLAAVYVPANDTTMASNQIVDKRMVLASSLGMPALSNPAAPPADTIQLYGRSVAGRMLPKYIGPSGVDNVMQSALFGNRIVMFAPSTGTTGTGSGTSFGPAWTSNGTVSHPTPATTAPAVSNQMKRTRYANVATTTNQQLGPRFNAASEQQFWRGNAAGLGGFFFQARFIVELYPAATVRIFAGLTNTASGSVVISDTVLNDTVGLWHDTTDSSATFNLVTRNTATTTKTAIALSNNIAAGNSYDFFLFCPPNCTSVTYRLDDLVNNVTYTGSTSTTLPTNTAFLQPQVQMSNGTANTSVTTTAIGVAGIYVESDR